MVKIYRDRFIDIDIDVSMQRVLQRHVATGFPLINASFSLG